MVRKRAKAKRKKTSRRKKTSNGFFRKSLKWLLALALLASLAATAYTLYLSKTVRVKFEGKRWSVPARVYARPLELYVGAPVSVKQMRHELETLGYRRVDYPKSSAQWSEHKGRFVIRTRAFQFWDESISGQSVEVIIKSRGVSAIRSVGSARALDLLRLEPAEIGSIYPAHKEDRILVSHQEIPKHLTNALLAVEDRRFFEHAGVDPQGIARALVANVKAGKTVQGGSTLTQQLVKNFVLTPERSLKRKINEAWMALIVDARYEKEEILEAYANEIFLGQDGERAIHGFGLASYFYFNRPLKELRLHETALLVGIVKGASYYNPRRHPKRAKKRRDLVIDQMLKLGFVSPSAANNAKAKAPGLSHTRGTKGHRYPSFIDLVRRQLKADYREEDLTSEGLRIFTTLDPWDQTMAARAVRLQLKELERAKKIAKNSLQAALVVSSPQSGEVRALVAARQAGRSGFNRALDAIRPIGSLVKPAVYLTALERPNEYSLTSFISDEAVTLQREKGEVWRPQNFDRKEHGKVMLHEALSRSLNLATVKLGMEVGLKNVSHTLRKLGVVKRFKAYPSMLLGSISLSPFEVTQMYQTIAAEGFQSPLRAIRNVLDKHDEPLQRYPLVVKRTIDQDVAYLVSFNLRETAQSGTAKGLTNWLPDNMQVAGKTGTTNDLRDSWFAGYSGDRVAVAWVGRDDNKPTKLTGSSGALTVWGRYMRDINSQSLELIQPNGIEQAWVEMETGALADESCEDVRKFPYIAGYKPGLKSTCLDLNSIQGLIKDLFGVE